MSIIRKKAGRISPVFMGNYDNSVTYRRLDWVYYGGTSYICKKNDTFGIVPSNTERWQKIIESPAEINIIFDESTTRDNIISGEKLSVILGKIARFFKDLKTIAFTGSYNDLSDKPNSLKNPNSLNIKLNGTTQTSYDGSVAKEVNITPAGISAVNTSAVLNTTEQISANTSAANITGALATKAMMIDYNNKFTQINSNLTSKDLYNSTNWVSGITNYAKTIRRAGDVVFVYVDFFVPDSYSGTYTSYPIMTGLPKPAYKYSFLCGVSIDGLFTQPMFEIDVDGKLYLQVRGTAVNGRRIFATILYIL